MQRISSVLCGTLHACGIYCVVQCLKALARLDTNSDLVCATVCARSHVEGPPIVAQKVLQVFAPHRTRLKANFFCNISKFFVVAAVGAAAAAVAGFPNANETEPNWPTGNNTTQQQTMPTTPLKEPGDAMCNEHSDTNIRKVGEKLGAG